MGTGWYQGGYTGRAIPGYYPATKGGPRYSEAGPGTSCREVEWVVPGAGIPSYWGRRRGRSWTTLRARSEPTGPSLSRTSQIAALQPIRARFTSFLRKVSQNGEVSPEIL